MAAMQLNPMQKNQIWNMILNKEMLRTKLKALFKSVYSKREKEIKDNGWNPHVLDLMPYMTPNGMQRNRWQDFAEAVYQL